MTKQQAEILRVALALTIVTFVVIPLGVPGLLFKIWRSRQ